MKLDNKVTNEALTKNNLNSEQEQEVSDILKVIASIGDKNLTNGCIKKIKQVKQRSLKLMLSIEDKIVIFRLICYNHEAGVYFMDENTNFKEFRNTMHEWEDANEEDEEEGNYDVLKNKYKPLQNQDEKFLKLSPNFYCSKNENYEDKQDLVEQVVCEDNVVFIKNLEDFHEMIDWVDDLVQRFKKEQSKIISNVETKPNENTGIILPFFLKYVSYFF